MIKATIKLLLNFRMELALYLALKAFDMGQDANEVMATMPDWTLAHHTARLRAALADIYAEVAKSLVNEE